MCSRQAATGSGSSSRTAVPTAAQRRSTSGSPNTVWAQPSFGKATIVQLQSAVGQLQRRLGDLAHARLPDALAVEVGEQLRLRVAADRAQRAAGRAELLEPLDEPRRRVAEPLRGGALDVRAADVLVASRGRPRSAAPAAYAWRAIARTSGACSISALIPSVWPGWRFRPTWTASRA